MVTPFRVSSKFSHMSFKIELLKEHNGEISARSQATGFVWRRQDTYYLVTNLHNLSGWDYIRDQAMSELGFLPDAVLLHLAFQEGGDNGQPSLLSREALRATLERDGSPLWLIHPVHRQLVDVAVLPLGSIDPTILWPADPRARKLALATEPVNTLSDWTDFEVDAGDDAYVLGYPKGLDGGKGFPLWKRGSIASEPAADIDGLPKALVDTATRPGMSGAPVMAVRRGIITPRSAGPSFGADSLIGQAAAFFGVYSGRVDDDPLGAQIGIVWKASVVDEIIDGGTNGTRPWDS